MNIIVAALAQGLLWAIMAIGVYITYRVLDIADLTAEGSFTLGAAVAVYFISRGVDPLLATAIAFVAGMVAGVVTGILHTTFKIPALLAGILTMTALYSINLRIMGKATVSLLDPKTLTQISVLNSLQKYGLNKTQAAVLAGFIVVFVVIILLWLLFNTEIGYTLRATGNNTKMVSALGVNTDHMKILGLIIGNGLVALSAALVAQFNGFGDITMGAGTIVIGLSSVIIGEVVFCWLFEVLFGIRNTMVSLISVVLGSILYRIIIAIVLENGLKNNDLKLFSSLLLAIALALPRVSKPIVQYFKKIWRGV